MAYGMDEKRWKIGELAAERGLTVRTLHHWDELGLLTPSERTGAGYRLYGEADVERLYRIVALRGLGLSLEAVGGALEGDAGLRELVQRQLNELEERIELEQRLRERLVRVLEAPTSGELMATIEVMTMIEKHYTSEQLATLEQRREQLGTEGMQKAQNDWAELMSAVEREYQAGTDPADPRVRELATRWQDLVQHFTGGDAGIRESLDRMYREEGVVKASRGMVKPELIDGAEHVDRHLQQRIRGGPSLAVNDVVRGADRLLAGRTSRHEGLGRI